MQTATSLNFLNRMRLWQKFLLLGIIMLVAVLFPYYQVMRTSQETIDFAKEELSGIKPSSAWVNTVLQMQLHRGEAAVFLGTGVDTPARATKEKDTNEAFAEFEKVVDERANLKQAFTKLKLRWQALQTNVVNKTITVEASLEEHNSLVAEMLLFMELIADEYKLSLDPNADTYYMVQAATTHLPALREAIGQVRAFAVGRLALAKKLRETGADPATAMTALDRTKMSNLLAVVSTRSDAAYRFLDKAAAAKPELKARLDAMGASPRRGAQQVFQIVKKELIDTPVPNYEPAEFLTALSEGLNGQYKLVADVLNLLSEELQGDVDEQGAKRLRLSLQILAAALVAALIGFLIVRNVTGTVAGLQSSVDQVRSGQSAQLQAVQSGDEVGDLGRTVNSLLTERMASQEKAEKENEVLNNSVVSLLQTVFQLGNRDLTVRAPVTEDIIGTVSSSINQLTDETSKTLSEVQDIAEQVRLSSESVRVQSVMVEETARAEREALQTMSQNLVKATDQLTQVASLSDQSNAAAEQVTKATQSALVAVDSTVKGIDQLRDSISDMEKRFKRLGERSQEISGAVQLINNISERTHVLALNASMQAATAGEAGRGFAVVAEEVQRLSDSSRQATGQISQLVGNIQAETNETLFTVDRLIGEVVKQSELAQRAGIQMTQTQTTTAQLVGLVRQIAAFSDQQAKLAGSLQQSVLDINHGNEQTSVAIAEQTNSTQTLADFSRRLTQAVGQFKLSDKAA